MSLVTGDNALRFASAIDNSGLKQGTVNAQGILRGFASNIDKMDIFAGLAVGGALAFKKIATSAFNMSKDYEQAMLEVATISEATQADFEGMSDAILEVGTTVPQTAQELSNAFYQIASAGFDGAQGLELLEISAKAAVGGVTDVETAADGVTTVLNAWKISANDAGGVTDKLFKTVKEGKTTFPELSNNISQVASIAASANIPLEEILAAIATMTKQGVPTAQAFTQIKSAIISTSEVLGDGWSNTMTFQEGMKAMADEADGSQNKLKELTGRTEAMNAVLALTGENAKMAASDLLSIKDSSGAAEKAFETMVSSAENQSKLLAANIEAALKPFGDWLLENYKDITEFLNEAFESGDIEKFAKVVGIGVSALVAYKTATKLSSISMMDLKRGLVAARKAMKGLNLAMKANPWGLIAAGLAAAATAFVLFNDEATETVKLQEQLSSVSSTAQKNIASQETTLRTLLGTAQDENKSLSERKEALNKLNEINPKYLGNLTLQSLKNGEAEKAVNAYTQALLVNATIQAAQEKIVELRKKQIEAVTEKIGVEVSMWEKLKLGLTNVGDASGYLKDKQEKLKENAKGVSDQYQKQIEVLAKLASKQKESGLEFNQPNSSTPINKTKGQQQETLNYYEQLKKKLTEAQKALTDLSGEEIDESKVLNQRDYIEFLKTQINDQEIILGLKEVEKQVDEEKNKEAEKAQEGSIKFYQEQLAIQKTNFDFAVNPKKRAIAKEEIKRLEEKIKLLQGVSKEQEKESDRYQSLFDGANILDGMSNALQNVNSELAEGLKLAGALINDVAGLATGVATGNYLQAAMSGISLIGNLVSGRESDEDSINKLIESQNEQLSKQIKLLEKTKGSERLIEFANSIDLARQKQQELNVEIQKQQDYINRIQDTPQGIGIIDDEIERLKQLEEQLESLNEQQFDLINQLYSTITTTTSDNITNSILEGFENGKKGAESFADTFESLMRNAILQSFSTQFLEQQFNEFYKSFGEAAQSGGGLTSSEIEGLRTQFNENITQAEQGFDAFNDLFETTFGTSLSSSANGTSSPGLSGEIQSKITEETGTVLAGTTNSIRLFVEAQNNILDNMSLQLGQIVINTDYNKNLERLENIELLLSQNLESFRSTGA